MGCPQSEEGNPSALKSILSGGLASDLPQPLSVLICPRSKRAHLALQDSTLNSGPGADRDCMGLGSCVSAKPLQPLLVRSTQVAAIRHWLHVSPPPWSEQRCLRQKDQRPRSGEAGQAVLLTPGFLKTVWEHVCMCAYMCTCACTCVSEYVCVSM